MVERRKQTGDQLLLRFAEGSDLRSRLQDAADASGRTLTKEVLVRLEQSLLADDRVKVPDVAADARLDDLAQRVQVLEAFRDSLGLVEISDKATGEAYWVFHDAGKAKL